MSDTIAETAFVAEKSFLEKILEKTLEEQGVERLFTEDERKDLHELDWTDKKSEGALMEILESVEDENENTSA